MSSLVFGKAEDQAWEVSLSGKEPIPYLNCGAEEADTRVWLHVFTGFAGYSTFGTRLVGITMFYWISWTLAGW